MTIDEKARKTLAELGVKGLADAQVEFARLTDELRLEADKLASSLARDLAGPMAKYEHERVRLLREFHDRVLGRRNGLVSLVNENWLKPLSKQQKQEFGPLFNEFRNSANEQVAALESHPRVAIGPAPEGAESPRPDLTLPGFHSPLGSVHPVTQVMREIEDIFLSLGFRIESGPEIESVYYNFDALNIPESHPARDDWDTLYINNETVLRTHTSPVQIRAMERSGAPLHIICPGKCYRRDNPDSTHSMMFHQVEGLAVDRDTSFADLKGTLEFFLHRFFGEEIKTSFHPSFFPFTEPSAEVAIGCIFCKGEGCGVCKGSGWLEVMGCGMVHPKVLRRGGIDPARYSGWAFGLGVERFAMLKYNISDIQLFYQSDVRFLEQF